MDLNSIDIATILVILGVNFFLGLYMARKASNSRDDYFLAGRSLTAGLIGTSLVATTFALDTPLVISEFIVANGLFSNWLWILLACSHLFVTFFIAPQWRRSEAMTDVELCEIRYSGRGARVLRAVKSLFFALILNGITLSGVFAAVRALCLGFGLDHVVFGAIPISEVILLGALTLTLIYSASAGLWGVVTTDVIQFCLALSGAVLVAWLSISSPEIGSFSDLRNRLSQVQTENSLEVSINTSLSSTSLPVNLGLHRVHVNDPLSLRPAGFGDAPSKTKRLSIGSLQFDDSGLLILVWMLVIWWAWKNADGGGVVIQRILAAKSEQEARKGMLWFCIAHYAIRWWPFALVGFSALIIFRDQPLNASTSYAQVVAKVVPAGLKGFVLAYFLAAFMSTVDTHLQLAGSYIVNDFYARFIKPDQSERHYIWVGRFTTLAVLLLALFASYFWQSFRQIYVFTLNLVAGAGVVFLLRWFWWRINAWSEVSALGSSLVIGGGLSVLKNAGVLSLPTWCVTIATVFSCALVWIITTLVTEPTDPRVLKEFVNKVRPFGLWTPLQSAQAAKPPVFWPATAWISGTLTVYILVFLGRGILAGDMIEVSVCSVLVILLGVLFFKAWTRIDDKT